MSKTWKDSNYAKIRLPRVPGEKVFKDSRFPSRNNTKINIRKELNKENRNAEDETR